MGKCLITKLNGSVQNDSLLRIGEFSIKVSKVESPTANSQMFSVRNTKDSQLRIIGDGYFTNETLSENKGKVMNIAANTETLVYYSNGDYEIVVSEKYSLFIIGVYPSSDWKFFTGNLSFNIKSLKYSTNIVSILLSDSQVTGDIAALSNLPKVSSILLNNTNVTGDIAVFGKIASLILLNIEYTNVTGDIAVFGKMANLSDIPGVNKTLVTGDISVYKNTKNKKLQFLGTSVYGDLSILPNAVLWVQGGTGTFTWTGIKNRTNILAVFDCKCNNIDTYLNDMATLEAKFAGEDSWYKIISLIGTRTSASDAAVQTLQSKGYTVSITPA